MRRKDKEVSDVAEIAEILGRCKLIHLAMADNGAPYVVPLNFGFDFDGKGFKVYFHSARAGRKVDMLANNPRVSFAAEASADIYQDEKPCEWGAYFESIIGEGEASLLEGEAKANGLGRIMLQNGYKGELAFPEASLKATNVYVINVSEICGKRSMPKGQ